MLRKLAIGGSIALLVLLAGAFLWARSVLTGDNVRLALSAQVEKAIGQPVSIGTVSATIMPRVTMTLGNLTIGKPGRITVGELRVGSDFRALLSRRIEHASLRLTGARIELPLPDFTIAAASEPPKGEPTAPPMEFVSIDEIVLSEVEVISGGRTLRGDIEVVPQGKGLLIRKIALGAGKTLLTATGQIADLAGPVGELTLKAGSLDMDQLLAFVSDFTAGTGMAKANTSPGAPPMASPGQEAALSTVSSGISVAVTVDADSATMSGLTLSRLSGKARITEKGVTLDPVSFGVFGGQYQGSLDLAPNKNSLRFSGRSTLSNVDVAAATKFGGSPDTITGRLSGRLDFSGSGVDAATVMKTVKAKARVEIIDGVVRNLGLVNAIVVASSMRSGALVKAASSAKSGPSDEPFSKLGATLDIAGGTLSTNDLLFESRDVILNAQGAVDLVASTVDLKGRVQLSDALSQQAGRDLIRYTKEAGRVTFPATVTGSSTAPTVRIDVGDLAKRAVRNAVDEQKTRAKDEATKAVTKKLGGPFRR